ncbi:unnamed protein product [Boreogadus saida]
MSLMSRVGVQPSHSGMPFRWTADGGVRSPNPSAGSQGGSIEPSHAAAQVIPPPYRPALAVPAETPCSTGRALHLAVAEKQRVLGEHVGTRRLAAYSTAADLVVGTRVFGPGVHTQAMASPSSPSYEEYS